MTKIKYKSLNVDSACIFLSTEPLLSAPPASAMGDFRPRGYERGAYEREADGRRGKITDLSYFQPGFMPAVLFLNWH